MKTGVLLVISILALSGCNDALRSQSTSTGVNVVPTTFENPDGDPDSGVDSSQPGSDDKVGSLVTKKDPSKIMYYAQKIMETEGRKIGTACNFYVHRVLQAAGFPYEIFLANDFDIYAKRYIQHFKAIDFYRDSSDAEEIRLKKHLWSYPERTPFITQWSRSGVHGHIAFVERIGDKLVIYQASLGTRTARKDQTTVEILLNGYNRRQLTVYSEMTPQK